VTGRKRERRSWEREGNRSERKIRRKNYEKI
jgi:hypothetical protein